MNQAIYTTDTQAIDTQATDTSTIGNNDMTDTATIDNTSTTDMTSEIVNDKEFGDTSEYDNDNARNASEFGTGIDGMTGPTDDDLDITDIKFADDDDLKSEPTHRLDKDQVIEDLGDELDAVQSENDELKARIAQMVANNTTTTAAVVDNADFEAIKSELATTKDELVATKEGVLVANRQLAAANSELTATAKNLVDARDNWIDSIEDNERLKKELEAAKASKLVLPPQMMARLKGLEDKQEIANMSAAKIADQVRKMASKFGYSSIVCIRNKKELADKVGAIGQKLGCGWYGINKDGSYNYIAKTAKLAHQTLTDALKVTGFQQK